VLHKDVVDFARNLSYRLSTAKDRSSNINTQLYTHLVNNDVDAAWEVIASAGNH
jgi:inactivated superfamily I helicase